MEPRPAKRRPCPLASIATWITLLAGASVLGLSCAAATPRSARVTPGRADPTESWTAPGEECREDADCDDGLRCYAPGFVPGPGMVPAPPPGCSADSECSPGAYCAEGMCAPHCASDESCGPTATCQAQRCVSIRCESPRGHGSCPVNFSCNAQLACERDACSEDDDCERGVCVQKHCYAKPGGCAGLDYCCPP